MHSAHGAGALTTGNPPNRKSWKEVRTVRTVRTFSLRPNLQPPILPVSGIAVFRRRGMSNPMQPLRRSQPSRTARQERALMP
jgi:hypothetical protein